MWRDALRRVREYLALVDTLKSNISVTQLSEVERAVPARFFSYDILKRAKDQSSPRL